MLKFQIIFLLLFTGINVNAESNDFSKRFYQLELSTLGGKQQKFADYQGKVLLIVNTASKCGFTGQYEGLEELYEKYKDKNFLVLGFPSNDFGQQEPGSDSDIQKFCKLSYGVSFPMFSKSPVTGESKNDLYKLLTEEGPEEFQGEVGWNFVKFLVDKTGKIRARHSSFKKPSSLESKIEDLLNE